MKCYLMQIPFLSFSVLCCPWGFFVMRYPNTLLMARSRRGALHDRLPRFVYILCMKEMETQGNVFINCAFANNYWSSLCSNSLLSYIWSGHSAETEKNIFWGPDYWNMWLERKETKVRKNFKFLLLLCNWCKMLLFFQGVL